MWVIERIAAADDSAVGRVMDTAVSVGPVTAGNPRIRTLTSPF